MVHCQDGSNPPSPAPPLVLGTLLPHFISGKFSRLLAQTQGRISRRGVCVCSSLPPPPNPSIVRRARRADAGVCGVLQGSCKRGAAPRGTLHRASAWLWRHRPRLGSHPSIHTLYRDLQTYKTHSNSPSRAHRFFTTTPPGWKVKARQQESGSCPPPLPPSCPGLRPEGLASSSNLICFRS